VAEALAARGVEVFTGAFVRSVPAHLRERGSLYDLVIVSRRHLAKKVLHHVRRHCPRARVVFDTVDLHFVRESRQRALEGKGGAADARGEREELALVDAADVTWVVSEDERRLLQAKRPAADVRVVSNVHVLEPPGPPFEARRGALFIGSFEHPPNLDAIRWYLEEVHPRVLAAAPGFPLRVIGTDAPAWLLGWRADGVEVVGHAPELAPHFDAVRLSVAPLRFGAGVKGKLNTSQSHGVPIVATPIATEGMGLVHGEDVFEAEGAEAFAAGVLRVHEDPALWRRLAAGGRANLAERFSVERARAEVERTLRELEAAGSRPE
jgi:glycosyltransferase involved in cell wall biosynthesis